MCKIPFSLHFEDHFHYLIVSTKSNCRLLSTLQHVCELIIRTKRKGRTKTVFFKTWGFSKANTQRRTEAGSKMITNRNCKGKQMQTTSGRTPGRLTNRWHTSTVYGFLLVSILASSFPVQVIGQSD